MGCGGLNQTHKHLQNPQYGICVVATRHPCRSIWWLVQRFYYPWSIRRISRKVGNHEKQAVECGPSSFPLVFNGQNMVVYPIFRYTHTHVFVSYCWLHTYIFSHTCIYICIRTYTLYMHTRKPYVSPSLQMSWNIFSLRILPSGQGFTSGQSNSLIISAVFFPQNWLLRNTLMGRLFNSGVSETNHSPKPASIGTL